MDDLDSLLGDAEDGLQAYQTLNPPSTPTTPAAVAPTPAAASNTKTYLIIGAVAVVVLLVLRR